MRSQWRDGERRRTAEVTPLGGRRYRVRVDEGELELEVEPGAGRELRLVSPDGTVRALVTSVSGRSFVRLGSLDFVLARDPDGARRTRTAAHGALESPMPGVVTRVMVAAGDAVKRGQPLVAVEAMKMEHLLRAPRDGRVAAVHARAGEMVNGGVTLVELDEAVGTEKR